MAPGPEPKGPGARRLKAGPVEHSERSEQADLRAITADVRRVTPLRPREQERLLLKMDQTDAEAVRERLLETHLGLVLAVAEQKLDRGLGIGDLFQEGSLGLLLAINSYAESGRSDFDKYARERISLAMEAALACEQQAVRQEQLLVAAAADYDRIELALARELRRAPTDAEIGARLEWSPARVKQIREIVIEARRRYDEEILLYLDPERVDLDPGEQADEEARA